MPPRGEARTGRGSSTFFNTQGPERCAISRQGLFFRAATCVMRRWPSSRYCKYRCVGPPCLTWSRSGKSSPDLWITSKSLKERPAALPSFAPQNFFYGPHARLQVFEPLLPNLPPFSFLVLSFLGTKYLRFFSPVSLLPSPYFFPAVCRLKTAASFLPPAARRLLNLTLSGGTHVPTARWQKDRPGSP
jgi:hypothetical protein